MGRAREALVRAAVAMALIATAAALLDCVRRAEVCVELTAASRDGGAE